ncbi:MAG: histidine--tRNA ligase [Sphingomonadaceae bacterium]
MPTIDTKPPSGMRDFLPAECRLRRKLFSTAVEVFERYGYLPLETPAMERLEILEGSYAEEGARQIYKVSKQGGKCVSGLGLRYNFTVPLARVAAEHQGKLGTLFKVYQAGPVWRGDRPGHGRYRESYHCDVDLVGSASPLADAEAILVLAEALRAMGIGEYTVRLSSRRLVDSPKSQEGLAEVETIVGLIEPLLEGGRIVVDPRLARGLDYYTGSIFEIDAPDAAGSLALGGRYDELIGLFAGRPVPACGGSLYMDRVALLLQGQSGGATSSATAMVTVWDPAHRLESLRLAAELRREGIPTELYVGEGGLSKQLRYASERGIPFCILLGPDEAARGEVAIKEMRTGTQRALPRDRVSEALRGAQP